jgi:hypothetical protein
MSPVSTGPAIAWGTAMKPSPELSVGCILSVVTYPNKMGCPRVDPMISKNALEKEIVDDESCG